MFRRALVGLVASAIVAGCASRLVDRVEDADAMRAAILRVAPPGTPIAHAARLLAAEGFTCQPSQRSTFPGIADSTTYAYCAGRSRSQASVHRHWQVALVDSAGTVTDVRATMGLVGP